jgi:alpha-1,3-rhamnosyltransferase
MDTVVKNATVSVVVPSYNHAPFVATCLRSIIKQSIPPTELLVIDDGSTDNSSSVIESVLKDAPFPTELIISKNRGLSATLNHALELSQGDYFAYLSSDDIWLEDFLKARMDLLQSRPNAILAYGHCYLIDEQNRIIDSTAEWANYADGDARAMLVATTAPMSPTVLYVREKLVKHSWNEQSALEDYELYLRLSLDGEFAFDPNVLSAWRWHEGNTSWNQEMMLDEHLSALEKVSGDLGISEKELVQLRKRIKFDRAEDFLRVGDKRKAVQLILENLDAAQKSRSLRIALRMLLPYRAVSWRRKRMQREAIERYGTIEI